MGQRQGTMVATVLSALGVAGEQYSHALSHQPLETLQALHSREHLETLQALQSREPLETLQSREHLDALQSLEPLGPQAPLEPLLLLARSNPLLSSLLEYSRHADLQQLFDDQPAVKRDDYEDFTDAGDAEGPKPCSCDKGNTTRYLGADYIPNVLQEKMCDHTKCPPYALCYNETITVTVFKRCESEPGPRQTIHRWPKVQRLDSTVIRHECLREEKLPLVSACACREHNLAKRRTAAP